MTRDSSIVKCPTCDGPITLTETMPHVYKAAVEHEPDCGSAFSACHSAAMIRAHCSTRSLTVQIRKALLGEEPE